MSTITKKLKAQSEKEKIFKCSLYINGLELENEFRLFEKLLSFRLR